MTVRPDAVSGVRVETMAEPTDAGAHPDRLPVARRTEVLARQHWLTLDKYLDPSSYSLKEPLHGWPYLIQLETIEQMSHDS